MEPTCFILLRHGETEANKAGILQGWYESPLDENGIRQVECAAEYLKERHIDAIYCSDLQRAIQTAEAPEGGAETPETAETPEVGTETPEEEAEQDAEDASNPAEEPAQE